MSKLDNFFRDKLNQREFEFEDAYWEAAEKLIDQDRRRRRFGAWWFWGGMLVLLLGGLYWWLPSGTNSVSAPDSSLSTTLPNDLENTDDNLTFNPNQNSDESKSATAAANDAQQPIEPLRSTSLTSNSDDETLQYPTTTKGTTTAKGPPQNSVSDQDDNVAITSTGEAGAPVIEDQAEEQKDELPPNASGGAADQSPMKLALDRMALREVPILPLLSEEPMEDLVPEAEEIIKLVENRPKLHYGLRAYSHFYPAQVRQQWWRGAAFGLTASYDLNKDWAIGADLLYTYQTGTFNKLKESEQINYSFGARVEQFTLTPTALHGIELPVYLIHKVQSHRLQAGFNLGYFIAMRAHVDARNSLYPWERETEDEIQTRFSATRREDTIWADQLDPIRRLQLALQLGYQYRIRPWLGLDFRAQLQLTNWKTSTGNSELFSPPLRRENQPITFQLGLSWYLR